MRRILRLLVLLAADAQARADGGIFVGTTPCRAPVRAFLGMGSREKCNTVSWELWLALWRVTDETVHLLSADRQLLVGHALISARPKSDAVRR